MAIPAPETTLASPDWPPRARALVDWAGAGHARALALLMVVGLLTFLPGFFAVPPIDRDESRFAQASRQMVETGNYVDIRLQGEPRHNKPIGIYWLQAAAVQMSGFGTEAPIWVYRLPSLIGALGGVLLTYWALFPLIGSRAALLAGLLMASTLLLGAEARIAKTDAVLFCCATAAMGALLRAFLNPARLRGSIVPWVFWIAVGLGTLVKGPITLMVVGLTATVLCVVDRSAGWLKALQPLWGALLAVTIAAPWFIAIAINSGGAFFQDSLGRDMLAKIGQAAEAHWGPPGYHLAAFWLVAWPATAFAALAIPALWAERGRREVVVLLAWAAPTWLVFELISTKLPHYVLPTYPALMGLIAFALVERVEAARTKVQRFLLIGLWALPLVAIVAASIALPWFEGTISLGLLILGAAAIGLGVLAARIGQDSIMGAVPVAGGSAIALATALVHFALPSMQTFWLSPRMAEAARAAAHCPNPRLASAAYHEPSLVFLTSTGLVMANGSMAADFLAAGGCRLAFVDAAPSRAGGESEEAAFLRRLDALGARAQRVAMVEGRNINGGHVRRMGLWRLAP